MAKRKGNDEHMSVVIQQMLKKYGLNVGIDKVDIKHIYRRVVGDYIADNTKTINLQKKVLFLHIEIPIMRQEIMMARSTLKSNLNKEAGRVLIDEIIVA